MSTYLDNHSKSAQNGRKVDTTIANKKNTESQ